MTNQADVGVDLNGRRTITLGPSVKLLTERVNGGCVNFVLRQGDGSGRGTKKVSFKLNGFMEINAGDSLKMSLVGMGDHSGKVFSGLYYPNRGGGFIEPELV